MTNISILSLILFIASGFLFTISVLLLGFCIYSKSQNKKFKKGKLIVLDELILVHTNEIIEVQLHTTEFEY